jgi:hypothetical protein
MALSRLSITLFLCASLAACSLGDTIGGSLGNMGYRTISIKSTPQGVQFTPNQVSGMLENMGYQRLEAREYVPQYGDNSQATGVRVSGELIDSNVDYRMLFRAGDLPSLLVRVRIVKVTGGIHIGIVEGESSTLSPQGRAKADEIAAEFSNLYGPDKVRYKN